jgi:hypothetical protein
VRPAREEGERPKEGILGFGGPARLLPELVAERDALLCASEEAFDPTDGVHLRMIRNVFAALTGRAGGCSITGSHWEAVGFQGSDPRTDLNRSMGVLSLLQALHLVETNGKHHKHKHLHSLYVDQRLGANVSFDDIHFFWLFS